MAIEFQKVRRRVRCACCNGTGISPYHDKDGGRMKCNACRATGIREVELDELVEPMEKLVPQVTITKKDLERWNDD